MAFELFDPKMDVRITAGKLPHWYQPGVTYFVTWRTDDSLPAAVAELWFRGHGECVLRRADLAAVVADNLRHFAGQRYYLGDFVVMPNHVHLLACLIGETDIEEQCYSWKKYQATKINRALGRRGRFWHEESFDHLVRTPEHFEHFRRYIADNPRKVGLHAGEFLHWTTP